MHVTCMKDEKNEKLKKIIKNMKDIPFAKCQISKYVEYGEGFLLPTILSAHGDLTQICL